MKPSGAGMKGRRGGGPLVCLDAVPRARQTRSVLAVAEKEVTTVPRLALSKTEAAESLGISVDHFERHVQPELRVVYRGRRRLIPIRELEKWLDREALRCGS